MGEGHVVPTAGRGRFQDQQSRKDITGCSAATLQPRAGGALTPAVSSQVCVHNAVLAGGVALSAPGQLIDSPWIAMVLGLLAGLISIGGAKCLVRDWSTNTLCSRAPRGPLGARGCVRHALELLRLASEPAEGPTRVSWRRVLGNEYLSHSSLLRREKGSVMRMPGV